jgi:2,4-dienoyl-CoA reductase (NADPH2)
VAAIVKDTETEELTDLSAYLTTQLAEEGVTVHLGKAVTPEVIAKEKPDALVLAAGAAHTKFELPGSEGGATGRKLIKTERLHSQLKLALKFFSAAQLERLTRVWMPVKKSAVIMGGTLHGCELTEFLVKRGRQVTVVHNGPESELGEGMGRDDLDNLWPWLKMKRVPIWTDVKYDSIVKPGLKIQTPNRRLFVLRGKSIMTTQDWGPNDKLIQELSGLVPETHIIGSCREPGWIVDAIREGALAGYAI